LDGNLTAGPNTEAFAWPGDSVEQSLDAGSTWNSVLTVADGVWSVDALDAANSWAVGVTRLYRSTDGGATWKTVGEPSKPLVTVDFVTPESGYGISTDGTLAITQDGGASWSSLSAAGALTSVCFSSPTTGYATNADGDVGSTSDSGQTWTLVSAGPLADAQGQTWGSVTCDGQQVAISERSGNPVTRWGQPYEVLTGAPDATPLNVISSRGTDQGADGTDSGTNVAPAIPENGVANLATAVPVGSGVVLLGTADNDQAPQVSKGTRQKLKPGTFPHLRTVAAPLSDYGPVAPEQIQGATFVGNDGWALINDAALGAGDSVQQAAAVYHTTDGGATWKLVSLDKPAPPAPMTR